MLEMTQGYQTSVKKYLGKCDCVSFQQTSSEASDGANSQGTTGAQPATKEVKTKGHIVIPYTQGPCESIKKICGGYGIQNFFKGSNAIRNLLVFPKDKDHMVSNSGAIYWF